MVSLGEIDDGCAVVGGSWAVVEGPGNLDDFFEAADTHVDCLGAFDTPAWRAAPHEFVTLDGKCGVAHHIEPSARTRAAIVVIKGYQNLLIPELLNLACGAGKVFAGIRSEERSEE